MRGYKRADERSSSDEEQMLRDSLGVPVFADPKRYLAGQRALQRHPDIDVFVLDDGFQHRRLARDLDVVLIDATNPFGYDHVLPRGMLRESLKGFARGDVTILTRTDLAPPGRVEHIEAAVRARNPAMPLLRSVHQLDQVMGDGTRGSIDRLHGKRVWAFCGLGNPEAFENALRKAGVELAGVTRFGDHHPYESADLEMLVTKAAAHHADVLLTTEKDFVKLRELPAMLSASVPVLYIGVRIVMDDASTQAIRSILKTCMTLPPASGAAL